MNQTTAFSPPLVVKLLDDSLVRFARSCMDHWTLLCEEIKAPKAARLRAQLDAEESIKPVMRMQLIEDIDDLEVSVDEAKRLCCNVPKWLKRHLVVAFAEAASGVDRMLTAAEIAEHEPAALAALRLIPATQQQEIAIQIAMLPVVKNVKVGSEENPFAVGADFAAFESEAGRLAAQRATASTGPESSEPSSDATPESAPVA